MKKKKDSSRIIIITIIALIVVAGIIYLLIPEKDSMSKLIEQQIKGIEACEGCHRENLSRDVDFGVCDNLDERYKILTLVIHPTEDCETEISNIIRGWDIRIENEIRYCLDCHINVNKSYIIPSLTCEFSIEESMFIVHPDESCKFGIKRYYDILL